MTHKNQKEGEQEKEEGIPSSKKYKLYISIMIQLYIRINCIITYLLLGLWDAAAATAWFLPATAAAATARNAANAATAAAAYDACAARGAHEHVGSYRRLSAAATTAYDDTSAAATTTTTTAAASARYRLGNDSCESAAAGA